MKQRGVKLNLGSGKDIKPNKEGWINVDSCDLQGVDIIHNLDKYPWPFADDSANYIYADNVLEHLNDILRPLEEIWRVSKKGALVEIIVPLFPGVHTFADPTHKQVFTYMSFNYFEKGFGLNYYTHSRFTILKRTIKFHKIFRFMELINFSEFLKKLYYVFFSQVIPPKLLEIKLRVEK